MYSRLDLIRDFMLGLMVLATVDTLVKLGFHNIVAYVASLPPNFVLVIIAFNLLVWMPSTSSLSSAGRSPSSSGGEPQVFRWTVSSPAPPSSSTRAFANVQPTWHSNWRLEAFTIVKRPQAPGRGTISSPAPPSSSTKAFTNVQPTSPSHSHFSGLLESNSTSNSAAVQSIPGEAPVVGLLYFPLLVFCCSVFVSFGVVPDPIPSWWRIVSGPEYSSVLLPAYNNIPIVHTTPVFTSSQPNNTEAQTDETGDVDAADSNSEENNEADITLVDENQRLLTYRSSSGVYSKRK
ncbi:hypothetical protein DFH08DRAFT_954107 [Mycena albidolilacea]|uniref:Uncharacterized protein n=1 Tax=Mycena albidolilacea TaxID=1033008 RepID=A0AAD7EZS3_9AGAR|nr:hypothetical protein DFH08DRAFT_954107 [Mycena albidolilacea]